MRNASSYHDLIDSHAIRTGETHVARHCHFLTILPLPLIHDSPLRLAQLMEGGPAPWYGKLIAGGGLILLAWLFFIAWRGKDDFRITVRGGQVRFRGRFPPGRRADTADFLLREVPPAPVIRVIGNWNSQRILRISVQGNVGAGERQRIRNFMKLTLKG